MLKVKIVIAGVIFFSLVLVVFARPLDDIDKKDAKNFLFILDVSGSMDPQIGGMFNEVKNTANVIVNGLESDLNTPYRLGLITFSGCDSSHIKLVINPSEVNGNGSQFLSALDQVHVEGTTALTKALREGRNVARDFKVQHPNKCLKIILLTDGAESCGENPAPVLEELLHENEECPDLLKVIYLGKDQFIADDLEKLFETEKTSLHVIGKEKSDYLEELLGQIVGLSAEAMIREIRHNNLGSRTNTNLPNRNTGDLDNEDPPEVQPAQPNELEANAQANERRHQNNGGN